ncbi:MAG: hypothetical protein HKN72_09240 [Gemmatimonadetes bacterium]|nr:hypothetical protein [Gemmatimonadota bacterium]
MLCGGGFALPYHVTPDGQRFLMARIVKDPDAEGLPEFVLINNFDPLLRERVPN